MISDTKAALRVRHITVPAQRSIVIAALVLSAIALLPAAWRSSLTEQTYDLIARAGMAIKPQAQLPVRIVVVDIDTATLELHGTWPWPRSRLAKLVTQIASPQPAAFAMDMLLAHADQRSASALARQLAQETGRQDIQNLADTLPDADTALASNLARMSSVVGFVLDPEKPGRISSVPLLMRDNAVVQPLWGGAGAIGPHTAFLNAISGMGMIGLPGDEDGTVRRVPLFVNAGGDIAPGLALEAVRVWQKASTYIVDGKMPSVLIGNLIRPLPDDAMLRLVPARAGTFEIVTVSARDILSGQASVAVLSNAIVFLGGSAPELGGLRTTNGDALIASVRIQADAAAQLIHGVVPRPLPGGLAVAAGLTFIAALLGVAVPLLFGPLVATLTILAVCSAFFASAVGLFIWNDWLVDPLFPSVAVVATFGMSSLAAFAHTRQQEARIRRRFEQHLAPEVVSMIVANPHVLRLRGERREITAMFTDVESFTSMTEKAAPEELVQVLDDYFEGVTALVIAYGGMVDKFVGDAVHAMFNVPLDQDNHARQAVACALAIGTWTETFRQRPLAQKLGFGRTRIGIETGEAIVGDIGLGSKLDYTAHGVVMNTAARMESANKIFGSTICLGPQVAQRCAPDSVRQLGTIDVRGLSKPLTIFEPWPEKADTRWRLAYQTAMATIDNDREDARAQFESLVHDLPDDRVVRQMADRLRAANGMPRE